MALASLVSFQEQKQGQKHQYFARRHSLKNNSVTQKRAKAVIGGENGQIFFESLVDTR